MYRKDQNPPSRFPENALLGHNLGRWMVARVKSRNEKALARDLMEQGIGYYLPMYEKRVRRKDNNKIRKTVCPLFPGYVSVAGGNEERHKILSTGRVAGILDVDDQERFVKELVQVQTVLDSGIEIEVYKNLVPGNRVVVKTGPFANFEGTILESQGESRLIISVNMFRRAVAVTVDPVDLEPA